jgi:WG repeat protein
MIKNDFTEIYDSSGKFIPKDNNIINRVLRFARKAEMKGTLNLGDDIDLIDNTTMKQLMVFKTNGIVDEIIILEKITSLIDDLEKIISCIQFILLNIDTRNFNYLYDHYIQSFNPSLHNKLLYDIKDELHLIFSTGSIPADATTKYKYVIEMVLSGIDKILLQNKLDEIFKTVVENNRKYYEAIMIGISHMGIVSNENMHQIEKRMRETIGYYHNTIRPDLVSEDYSKWLIPPRYTYAQTFYNGLAVIAMDEKYGFVNSNGIVIENPKYDDLINYGNGILSFYVNGKWGFICGDGAILYEPQFEEIGFFFDESIEIKMNGREGYIDAQAELVFHSQSHLDEEIAQEEKDLLNNKPEVTSKHTLGKISERRYYLKKIKQNEKYGFADHDGRILIEPQFDEVGMMISDFIWVKKNGKWGFISSEGVIIIEPEFENESYFHDEYSFVKKNGKFGFIDKTGKYIIVPQFDSVYPIINNFAWVKKNNMWGLINIKGEFIIDPHFEWVDGYSFENVIRIRKDRFYYLLDISKKALIEPGYDKIWSFDDSIAHVEINGKHGLINKSGEVIVEPLFDWVLDLFNGIVPVQKDGKWGYIDMKGNELTDFIFDKIKIVSGGIAAVAVNDRWGYITITPD